jgi:hypothetical protein
MYVKRMTYILFSNPVSVKTSPILPIIRPQFRLQSLFSDNSIVCYKLHNQSGGGVGTVRNARRIGSKT